MIYKSDHLSIKKVGLEMKGVKVSYNLCLECVLLFQAVKPVLEEYPMLKK